MLIKVCVIIILVAMLLTTFCSMFFGFKDKSVRESMLCTRLSLYVHSAFVVGIVVLAVIVSLLNPNFNKKAVVSNTKLLKEVVQTTPLHNVTKLTMNPYLLAMLNSHTINTLCIAEQKGTSLIDVSGVEKITNDYIITTELDSESIGALKTVFQDYPLLEPHPNIHKCVVLMCVSWALSVIISLLVVLTLLFLLKLICQLIWHLYDKYHKEPVNYDDY